MRATRPGVPCLPRPIGIRAETGCRQQSRTARQIRRRSTPAVKPRLLFRKTPPWQAIVFDATAGTFIINAPANTALTLGGTGITNNSGNTQIFFATTNGMATGGSIIFANNATAGALTNLITDGGAVSGNPGGKITFLNGASAGSAAISNNGGTVTGANGGITSFSNNATAGSGTFTNYGGIANGELRR